MSRLQIEETLLDCVIEGTIGGLEMTGLAPTPVGASRFLKVARELSVMVSLHGESNGGMILNVSKGTACFLAGRLLGMDFEDLDEDAADAMCELGNMVAGRFKELLMGTPYTVATISLPAMVMGMSYSVYHSRGIVTAAVDFEIPEVPLVHMEDRFFTCAISRMQR